MRGRDGMLCNGDPGPGRRGHFRNDERWKGAQLADARKGIFGGKYGKAEQAKQKENKV